MNQRERDRKLEANQNDTRLTFQKHHTHHLELPIVLPVPTQKPISDESNVDGYSGAGEVRSSYKTGREVHRLSVLETGSKIRCLLL